MEKTAAVKGKMFKFGKNHNNLIVLLLVFHRCGASKGSHVCTPPAAPHQRAALQHPVHHYHTGHAHGRGFPLLQHQEPKPQVRK